MEQLQKKTNLVQINLGTRGGEEVQEVSVKKCVWLQLQL